MKKKVKLFSTIASLCLAVALMAFGVLAATTETFKVTSSVNYSVAGQVNAEFTVKVTYKTNGVTVSTTNITDGYKDDTTTKEDYTTRTWTKTRVPGDASSEIALTLGDYTFNENALKDDTIVYEISINNKSANDKLSVELTNYLTSSESESEEVITIEVSDEGFTEGQSKKTATVDKSSSITYKVTYKLSSPTKDATKQEFKPSFAVSIAQNN